MHSISLARRLLVAICLAPLCASSATDDKDVADLARSINALGLDLYREQIKTAGGANVLLSPYSISSALAMTYLGADGETKKEMQRVLRLPSSQQKSGESFLALTSELLDVFGRSEREAARARGLNVDGPAIELSLANRIFIQTGNQPRPRFLAQSKHYFDSGALELDFKGNPERAREEINQWVADQTHDRIRDLLSPGMLSKDTRLALANALYLRAAWADAFERSVTRPQKFHLSRSTTMEVDTMQASRTYGYLKRKNYTVVTVPYAKETIQCALIVPDSLDGLSTIEHSITAKELASIARLKNREVQLHLPRFKLEPDAVSLTKMLKALGLRATLDEPKGTANFELIAPRNGDEYLFLDAVVHKAWLSLDEDGTEAAAATISIVTLGSMGIENKPPPIEVRVDRPFMFAIQHVESGVCLFLGRVTDPR